MIWEIVIIVLVLGISLMLFFRKDFSELLGRWHSVSGMGISADTFPQKTAPEKDLLLDTRELMKELDSPLLKETEQVIQKEFNQRNLMGADAIPELVRYLASASLALGYEQTYRMIWGSQLAALSGLVAHPEGREKVAIMSHYTLAASQYREVFNQYAFDDWLSYLQAERLLREDGGQVRLTRRGREFLQYLSRMERSLKRPG